MERECNMLEEDKIVLHNSSDDEIWDLYDQNRMITGRKHRRGDPLEKGEYHLVVHLCIFNSKNQLLIQRRQPWKKKWPGLWDLTVGGSAVSGDNSQSAAMRETREELGLEIDLRGIRPHFTVNFDSGFDDYYFITKDIDISQLTLQESEVAEVKWVDKEELLELAAEGEMIQYFFLDKIFDIKNQYGIFA